MINDIRLWIANHPNEIRLFCVSFLIHLVASVFLYSKFGDRVLYFENEDASGYVSLAHSVIRGEGFIYEGLYSAMRTPAYPLLLALIFLLRLPITWAILILQNIIASIAAVLVYRIGEFLFSKRVGRIAGYIYALEPYMLMTANLATTETFFNFLILCFVYIFGKWYFFNQKNKYLLLSGLFLGLAILTRPVAKFLPAVVLFFIATHSLQRKDCKLFLLNSFIFLGIFFAIIAPWSVRQYVRFGTMRITNIDANMMYFRIAPMVVSFEDNINYVDAIGRLKDSIIKQYPEYTDRMGHTFLYYDFMVGETKRLVFRHPGIVVKYYAFSLIPGLTGTGYEYMLEAVFDLKRSVRRVSFTELLLRKDFGAYANAVLRMDIFQITLITGALVWVCAYILIFWALFSRIGWQEHFSVFLFLLIFAGYFIFFSLGPQIHARYRMPSLPFLYILLAYAIDRLIKLKQI